MPARPQVDPGSFDGTVVYTDGACTGNPGPGGWAWAVPGGPSDSGGQPRTTNQRMELTAALHAVTELSGPLLVMSDSTYVVNCFRDNWWRGWLARGWVNSQRKPVANRDLWEPLIGAVQANGQVTFSWVKGHSGDQMNDLVDQLAVAAAARVAAGGAAVNPPAGGSAGPSVPATTQLPMELDTSDYPVLVLRAVEDHLRRTSRAGLGLPPPHDEADDDLQRDAVDDVLRQVRRLARGMPPPRQR